MARNFDYGELRTRLQSHLVVVGSTTAGQIGRALGVSQATVSRLIQRSSDFVIVIGRGPATRYIGLRDAPRVGRDIPVYTVDDSGRTLHCATLRPALPAGYYVEARSDDIESRLHEDLPYFLNELRPTGFLGRLTPRRHPDLELPHDITRWSADQCLIYLTRHGWNLSGNLIVGERALGLYLESIATPPATIRIEDRATRYIELAEDALGAATPGSSAGGEQPKFLATLDADRQTLVKFSPRLNSASALRVADLLAVEHIGHQVLRDNAISSACSELVITDERVFLEVERFDRLGGGGRRGVLSLLALDSEFVGALRSWSHSALALREQGRIDAGTATRILWLELFGQLIGNTDMHFANLSFFIRGEHLEGLAPIYDMLPMFYMPQHDDVRSGPHPLPTPLPIHAPVWRSAYTAARELWSAAALSDHVSDTFRRIAASNLDELEPWSAVAEKLPE